MSLPDIGLVETDFAVFREDYSRYLVEDGTQLKAKIVVKKIFKTPTVTAQGYPVQMGFDSVNIVSAQVPDRLKRKPSMEIIDLLREVGTEMKFDLMGDQKWQEYLTADGLRILVKPVITKVVKYGKYNNFGEPVYNANMQSISNIEKVSGT